MDLAKAITLGAIVLTVCIMTIVVVVAPVLGKPVDSTTQLYVFSAFTALFSAAATWLVSGKIASDKAAAQQASLP